MRSERDSLKETIEELHCVQAQEGQFTSGEEMSLSWNIIGVALPLISLMNSCSSYLQRMSAFKGLFPLGSNDGSDSLAAEITTPEMRYVCVYICFNPYVFAPVWLF